MPLEHEGIRQVDMDRVAQIARLRAVNAKLLEALETLTGAFQDNPNKPLNSKDWEYTIDTEVFAAAIPQARAVIEEAKK